MTDKSLVNLMAELDIGRWTLPSAAIEIPRITTPAEMVYQVIMKQIIDFESGLDDMTEIGARLVGGPDNSVFHIDHVECKNPNLILFFGRNEHGRPLQLIQCVSQVNVLLTALPKQTEDHIGSGSGRTPLVTEIEALDPSRLDGAATGELPGSYGDSALNP
jgi:hypothetical protein